VRTLLLSDIHSNLEALEACLSAAPAYDRVANLGDIVGYGGSPNEVTQRCREITWVAVRGNHDKVCTGIESTELFNPIAAMAAYWTRQTLTKDNSDWLRSLPEGPVQSPELPEVQFVHGSPFDEDEYMISILDATEVLDSIGLPPVTFFGHSHIQGLFYMNGNKEPQELRPVDTRGARQENHTMHLLADSTYLINPGSVGQPRDGDWRASFALYDSAQHAVTFLRVPYDIKRAQQHIREAQLPERLALRLGEGR
jgi:diadenosine tetraphosphatase ApaH/serine/threonine PP2A family protein phosphatase